MDDTKVEVQGETPQFAIIVQPDPDGKLFIGWRATTTGTIYQAYLCRPQDARLTAQIIHDQIVKAGQDAKRQERELLTVEKPQLVVVKGGMPNGNVPQAQGGLQRGPRRTR